MASSQPCFAVHKKRRILPDMPASPLSFGDVGQMDAQTYLQSVVMQANALPDYFTASNQNTSPKVTKKKTPPKSRNNAFSAAASLQYLLSSSASLTPPPSTTVLPQAPVQAWVDTTLADFTALRAYLQKCASHWGKARTFPYTLPALKERAAWHTFMVGPAEAEGNVGQYFATSDSDSDSLEPEDTMPTLEENSGEEKGSSNDDRDGNPPSDNTPHQSSPDWRVHVPSTGYSPDTTLLLQMDQVMVRQLLSHLAYYSHEGWHMTRQRGAWCYALLARLETPIHRDQAVVFYNWLKTLTAQRAELAQDKKDRLQQRRPSFTHSLASLNTVVAILGIYFEQGGGFPAIMQVPT